MGYRSASAVNAVLRYGAAGPILVKLTNSVASDLMDETVNLYQAKTHLSPLVERAANGAEVVIANGGKPKAKTRAARRPRAAAGACPPARDHLQRRGFRRAFTPRNSVRVRGGPV